MNCPNCNEAISPLRETRTTTGVTARFACPCGLSFNAYRPAYGEWVVSLVMNQATPKPKRVDANRARRALILAAFEDCKYLGRLGIETEQARQLVISAKEKGNANRQELPKKDIRPGKRQRQWAAGGFKRRTSGRTAGHQGAGRINGASKNG